MALLGESVPLPEVLSSIVDCGGGVDTWNASLFRVEFTNDVRAKEMRWVLFTANKRGSIGKIIFTLEKENSAHIKSISINKEWRGACLARILYHACLATLGELKVQQLCLEAEEDTRRHGKLVGMYSKWGFEEKPDAKVLFLYNNNECFRKVPMHRCFQKTTFFPAKPDSRVWFCMIALKTVDGSCVVASADGAIDICREKSGDTLWQTLVGPNGEIFLRSVHGKFLCAEESGNILADRKWNSTWETFVVVPIHESQGGVALQNFHGGYLGIDPVRKRVISSHEPVPWDGDLMNLVCDKNDRKPLHVKLMRKYQTESFVTSQMKLYGGFDHARMTVAEACRVVLSLNGDSEMSESWVLRYMVCCGETLRAEGHPDWLQLALFLRGLGLLFLNWCDQDNSVLRSISWEEWLIRISTWVVGLPIPDSIDYPELNYLNADHSASASKYDQSVQQCGMENVMMPWTADEYLYRVLDFNKTSLPSEALQVIRFWSCSLWHEQNHYEFLCTPHDFEAKELILCLSSCRNLTMEALDCVNMEKSLPHYISLAEKYLPATLQW